MTTLIDFLTPVDLTDLKAYLEITGSTEDTRLTLWYTAAIEWCNEKLSDRDFVDDDDVSIDPPTQCVLATYEYTKAYRSLYKRAGGSGDGVKKIKTGDREEEYEVSGIMGTAASQAGAAAWPNIEPYCEDPSLFASGGGW